MFTLKNALLLFVSSSFVAFTAAAPQCTDPWCNFPNNIGGCHLDGGAGTCKFSSGETVACAGESPCSHDGSACWYGGDLSGATIMNCT